MTLKQTNMKSYQECIVLQRWDEKTENGQKGIEEKLHEQNPKLPMKERAKR